MPGTLVDVRMSAARVLERGGWQCSSSWCTARVRSGTRPCPWSSSPAGLPTRPSWTGWWTPGFLVLGGPLADEHRVAYVVEAESEAAVRATLARDPWSGSHLLVAAVDPWTIRLDGRRG